MRLLFIIASLLPLAAQTPPKSVETSLDAADTSVRATQATKSDPGQAPAAPTPPAAKAETKSDASPVPVEESWLTGSIDLGYRWRSDVGGSFDTYRSIVNLGSGPKLLGADFTLLDRKSRLFDQAHIRGYNWGDDPYSTFHLDATKTKLYDFTADYRNIAYFNYLPSYADPLIARGVFLNEQSFDTRRRTTSIQLDLLPGNWFVPYLAFDRGSGSGYGVTAFVSDLNEYAVPNTLRDMTNLYRGGVRFELRRFHLTLEEGGTTFKDDQSVYVAGNTNNFGNVSTPFLGQRLYLTNLLAAYGIRGDSTYSKGLLTANATPWMDVYGQFLFSQPDSTVRYQQANSGNFILPSQLLFYNSQQYLVSAAAKLPHTSASLGAEIRPMHRVRIIESWLTDRLHTSSSAASIQALAPLGISGQTSALLSSSLATNYSQQEINVFFDATSRLTLRGGYRHVWGDARDATLPPAGLVSSDTGKLRRNVGIGGVTFRPSQKISMSGEAEGGWSSGAYFRTSLYNYGKVRARGHYQATTALSLSADFILLDNQNPTPGAHYDYRAQQESVSFFWSPAASKRWDFQGSYSRSALRSDIFYLVPETLQPERSFYRDNSHTATALFSANLPGYWGLVPKVSAGGSFVVTSGSRPTSYYQPAAKLFVPLRKNLSLFAEWQYYGYGEAFYLYEGFRTHLLTAGLRLTR